MDPGKIGMMGFSAGGEVTALTGMHYELSPVSTRPDFLALIYPYIRPETKKIDKNTPPSFLVHADDDKLSAEISTEFYLDLKRAGVSGELHVYATGGHGFGMKDRPLPVTQWTARFLDWLRVRGLLL